MNFVVDHVYVAAACPKFLQGVCEEARKTLRHAFPDEESVKRFVAGIKAAVELPSPTCRKPVSVHHTHAEDGGNIVVRRSDVDGSDYLRIHYFHLAGHLSVSQDGQKVFQYPYLPEDSSYVENC